MGFEPTKSCLEGRRVGPLHYIGIYKKRMTAFDLSMSMTLLKVYLTTLALLGYPFGRLNDKF